MSKGDRGGIEEMRLIGKWVTKDQNKKQLQRNQKRADSSDILKVNVYGFVIYKISEEGIRNGFAQYGDRKTLLHNYDIVWQGNFMSFVHIEFKQKNVNLKSVFNLLFLSYPFEKFCFDC